MPGRSFQSSMIQIRMKFWPQRNCWLISRNTWNRQLGNSVLKTCHKQWKRVQHLAEIFWSRWRREYLLTLQPRRKWQNMTRNVQKGDLVLLRCKDAPRNDWPLARVTRGQADSDGMVQGVDLVTVRGGSKTHFKRPITETILLKTENQWIWLDHWNFPL